MEDDLLERFVQSFQKAIRVEMEAMRARLGPFEIPLTRGRSAESIRESTGEEIRAGNPFVYAFDLPRSSEKLVPNTECVLRSAGAEWSVTLIQVGQGTVQLTSPAEISLSDPTRLAWSGFARSTLPASGSWAGISSAGKSRPCSRPGWCWPP